MHHKLIFIPINYCALINEETSIASYSGVVCLKGGNSPNEGNVFIGGKPVCDDSWDTRYTQTIVLVNKHHQKYF